MRTRSFFILVQLVWATGYSQHLSFSFGTPFRRPDLNVRWNLTTNSLPANVWIYQLLPKEFSPSFVSNLVVLGGFSEKEIIRSNADEILFRKSDDSSFWISPRLGAIEYHSFHRYGPTNLAEHVPKMNELPKLTTNFLKQAGINIEDIEKRPDGSPNFHFSQPLRIYFVNHTFITNIEFRSVGFRRAVDGASFTGAGTGGDCHIDFGEFGRPSQIRLSWRTLERYRKYPTASPETITNWIRQGKAVQGMIRMDAESIDWKTVKSLNITKAELCYYGGGPFHPADWLMPFVALWTTVDRGHGTIEVEVDCPIIQDPAVQNGK